MFFADGNTGNSDVVIEMEQPTMSNNSSFEDMTSPDSHVTKDRDHMTGCDPPTEETSPLLEGTLILTPRRGSDTEMEIEKREELHGQSFTDGEPVGGVSHSSSAHCPLLYKKSSPIPIVVSDDT